MKEIDRKQGVQSESAILVGVELPNRQAARDNLDELAGLVETAGAEVVGRLTQKRATPRSDDVSRQGQGRATRADDPRHRRRRGHLRQQSFARPDPQFGTARWASRCSIAPR